MRIRTNLCAIGAGLALGGGVIAGPESQVGRDTHAITLELIMQDPAWVARSPEGAYWADDGESVYFRRQREGSDLRDLYRVGLDGGDPALIPDDELASVDVSNGDWSRDRSLKVYVRDGDLFIKDVAAGTERQLTRTTAAESRPQFLSDENAVAFRRGGTLLVRELDSGLEWEPADVRFEKTPEQAREKKEKDKDYLDRQQDRFFEVLEEHRESRHEREGRTRALREIDRTDVPGPFYLPEKLEERRRSLSPDGRWMIVVGAKPAKDGERDDMPKYVTESGYVDVVSVRPKVGFAARRDDRVFLLDLEAERWTELERDGLPTITDDPLAWLREKVKDDADDEPEEADEESDEETGDESGDGDDSDSDDTDKPRPVTVMSVRWRPDSSMVALMLRSNDNKDRWIVSIDTRSDEPQFDVIDHLHDEAWINWRFNEMEWLRNGTGLWFLSEESGYSHLYMWMPESDAWMMLTSGEWEVSGVVESDADYWGSYGDGTLFFRANIERPIEHQVYRIDWAGGRVFPVTDVPGQVERFQLSPDGKTVFVKASSAISPPELFLQPIERDPELVQLTTTLSEKYTRYPWIEPEFVAIEGDHGRPIWTKVYQVDRAWEGEGRPGIVFVHGAGYTQNSDDAWPYYFREQMFHSMLAYLGYVVIDMDYRASSGYGRDWRTAIYRNMGRPELEDFSDGIDWMVRTHGVDPTKIGIYGGSYGGFMALMALFLEPGTYACGASLRPVTDWAHYSHGYTSNILNTPELDPEAFERSSPIEFAEGLDDPLLICHGMLDDNVVFQDTVRLAQRLIELGKEDWEVAMYPLESHSFTEPSSWLDEYRRVLKLFETTLRSR